MAITLVLLCHLFGAARGNDRYFAWGSAGVTLFFTLSGFLITSGLLKGQSLRDFYIRRARRLLPALGFVLTVFGGLMFACREPLFPWFPVIGYFANWSQLTGHDLGIMRQTWSLAIEEQFYLAWPWIIMAVRRWRNGPVLVCIGGIVASTALKFALISSGGPRIYYGTDTQAAALLMGALLAIWAPRGLPAWRLPSWTLLLLLPWALPATMWMGWLVVPALVPPLAVGLVWSSCTMPAGLLHHPLLRYLGRRSYSIYLWHYPLIMISRMAFGPSLAGGTLALLLALGLAELSWRAIESPCLGLRPSVGKSAVSPAPSGV